MPVRVSVFVLLAALSTATPRLDAQAAPAGYPEIGAPAVVTLSSSGAEPRRALRYTFTKGRQDQMSMAMTMGMAMDVQGMSMPQMDLPTAHMTATMTTNDISASGDTTVTALLQGMTWDTNGDANIAALLQSAADLKGMTYTVPMSTRGIMGKSDLDLSKIANPQLSQVIGSMSSSLQSLSMPLPEEAVGVGATWEVRQAMSNGMRIYQRVQVELASLTDRECTLKVTVSQTAPPQPVSNPALPAGVQASLDTLQGTGTGTMMIRFDSVVPTSEMTSRTATTMSVDAGTGTQQIGVTATIKLSVAPVK
jgi:hypothetical protein